MRTSIRSGLTALVVVLALSVSACGRLENLIGPSPTPDPSSSPSPGSTGTPWSELPPLSAEAKDFIVQYNLNAWYGHGAVTRWDGSPITVYADPGFRPEDLVAAVDFWQEATSGKVTFRIVTSAAEAAIVLDMQWPPPSGESVSEQSCGVEDAGRLNGNVIVSGFGHYAFGTKPSCGPREGNHRMGLAHGIGHILGLGWHTNGGMDIMDGSRPTWNVSPLLSEIINWLYSVSPGTRPV
jgi:hypothetical protein